jgi:hypothetical protein
VLDANEGLIYRSVLQYGTVQYSTVQYSTVQYSTVQYGTVRYGTVQYSTVQYGTVRYSTEQNRNVYRVLMGKHETTSLIPSYQTTRRLFPLLVAVRI